MTADNLIEYLGLVQHPEGGWFRETYCSQEQIQADALPQRFGGKRAFSTAIYFMLKSGGISALHRIKSDEIWHFYSGIQLLIHIISPDGSYSKVILGGDLASGQQFQYVVSAGCWFGAEPVGTGYVLVGCTVAPGFDFADFELARREELMLRYPQHVELITLLTRA